MVFQYESMMWYFKRACVMLKEIKIECLHAAQFEDSAYVGRGLIYILSRTIQKNGYRPEIRAQGRQRESISPSVSQMYQLVNS